MASLCQSNCLFTVPWVWATFPGHEPLLNSVPHLEFPHSSLHNQRPLAPKGQAQMLLPLGRFAWSLPPVRINGPSLWLLQLVPLQCSLHTPSSLLDCQLSAGEDLALHTFVSPALSSVCKLIPKNVWVVTERKSE